MQNIKAAPNNIKALVMDLDGTILAPAAVLTERTKSAIKKCKGRGINIIIATGRSIDATEPYRSSLDATGPMIYFNGAMVVDMPEGKSLSTTMLDTKVVETCLDLSREMGVHFQVFFLDAISTGSFHANEAEVNRISLLTERDGAEREMYRQHTGILAELGDLKENIKRRGPGSCIKSMFICEPEVQAEIRLRLYESLGTSVYVVQTLQTFLEVMDVKASKGQGLKFIMERQSLKKEEVIAFGDEENDLPMLEVAGLSVVPSNAKAAVKARSSLVTGSNAEDGVAAFLEEFFGL